jgi:hypothetical protein
MRIQGRARIELLCFAMSALAMLAACSSSTPHPAATPRMSAAEPAKPEPAPTTTSGAEPTASATSLAATGTSNRPLDREAVMGIMTSFRDRMCACQDFACAQAVYGEMNEWTKIAASQPGPAMTDADEKRASDIGEETGRCFGALQQKEANQPGNSLDRAIIYEGVMHIRDDVAACGDKFQIMGRVKVRVVVSPDGRPTAVSVEETPGPGIGECVAKAMRNAVFRKTKFGGSFTYPFVF